MMKKEQQSAPLPESVQKVIDRGCDELSDFILRRFLSIVRKADFALLKMDKQTYEWVKSDINDDLTNAAKRLKTVEIIDPHQTVPVDTVMVEKRKDQFFGAYLQAIAFDHDRRISLR